LICVWGTDIDLTALSRRLDEWWHVQLGVPAQ
jgi:hypothetical protein